MNSARAPRDHDYDILREVPLLSDLKQVDLEHLLGSTSIHEYGLKEMLFSAGDEADSFYVVLHGSVHMLVLAEDGSEGIVRIFTSGDSLAEAAMFGTGEYPLSAEAQAGSVLARVEKERFLDIVRARPELTVQMFQSLMARQNFMMEEVRRLRTHSPAQRLAAYLLTLYEYTSWHGKGQLPLPKQLIAARIGVDPATLSRMLRRLEDAGIKCSHNDVQVTDVGQLRAFSDMGSEPPKILSL